jgi:hypothetical protein
MLNDQLAALVSLWTASGGEADSHRESEAYRTVAASLATHADAPDQLRELRASLSEAEAMLRPEDPAAGQRRMVLQTLAAMAEALLVRHPAPGRGDAEVAALASTVRTRANALQVLRELAAGRHRPAEVRKQTGLSDPKIFRVLSWGIANGLVLRWEADGVPHYGLTGLGDLALKTIDEAAWLRPAVTLVRLVSEELAAERKPEDLVPEIARLMSMPDEQVARGIGALRSAMAPVLPATAPSPLALALGGEGRVTYISTLAAREFEEDSNVRWMPKGRLFRVPVDGRVSPTDRLESWHYQCAEAALTRGLESSGVPAALLEDWMSSRRASARDGSRELDLQRSVLALSIRTAPAAALLAAYGRPLVVQGGAIHLRTADAVCQFERYPAGFVVRLFDPRTTLSHFLVGGNTPTATLAAARCFQQLVNELLVHFHEQSFGVGVSVVLDPLQSEEVDYNVLHAAPLATTVPESTLLRVASPGFRDGMLETAGIHGVGGRQDHAVAGVGRDRRTGAADRRAGDTYSL